VDPAEISESRRRRIQALFDRALDLSAGARADYLSRSCEGDPEIRREVDALLAAAERTGVTARLAGALVAGVKGLAEPAAAPSLSQYEIVEQLGGGGMGVVYKARDRRLQRLVALKYLAPSSSTDPDLKSRFLREATAVASLDHPNVCGLIDVAEPEDGQLVIVMPFYEGETLKRKIERGPLPVALALDYARQIAAGLAHAHAAGVVHRDIKPANVIVTSGDRVKILDFGIAKVSSAKAKLTRTGALLGTIAYMSPEQAGGEPVDHRTDLWSLGAVLYEMLTGRAPFTGDTLEALFLAILWQQPERVTALRTDVPAGLEALVHRLLEKDPGRRYESAMALTEALRHPERNVPHPEPSVPHPEPSVPHPEPSVPHPERSEGSS
jgi:serine/threonine protein kinase